MQQFSQETFACAYHWNKYKGDNGLLCDYYGNVEVCTCPPPHRVMIILRCLFLGIIIHVYINLRCLFFHVTSQNLLWTSMSHPSKELVQSFFRKAFSNIGTSLKTSTSPRLSLRVTFQKKALSNRWLMLSGMPLWITGMIPKQGLFPFSNHSCFLCTCRCIH